VKRIVLSFAFAASFTGAAADERRLTNAVNVRLRSSSSTDAPITAELPLGTELVVLGQTNAAQPWYHVKTDDGRDGWVLGSLTTSIDPDHKEKTIEAIVEARLRRDGSFSDAVQLFELIERTAAGLRDPETQARFALHRMRAMSTVFGSVPDGITDRGVDSRDPRAEPYGNWIRAHLDEARYDEPGGGWIVDPGDARAVHDKHRQSDAADEMAWFYVTDGQLGECEGNVPCYVARQFQRRGWYLTEHPRGRHVDEATANIAQGLNGALDNLLRFPAVLAQFDPKTGCGELHASLDPLTAAVTASTSTKRAEALVALGRFAQLCN
jgi:hypothetical protein